MYRELHETIKDALRQVRDANNRTVEDIHRVAAELQNRDTMSADDCRGCASSVTHLATILERQQELYSKLSSAERILFSMWEDEEEETVEFDKAIEDSLGESDVLSL